jgi:hypothetical protein
LKVVGYARDTRVPQPGEQARLDLEPRCLPHIRQALDCDRTAVVVSPTVDGAHRPLRDRRLDRVPVCKPVAAGETSLRHLGH